MAPRVVVELVDDLDGTTSDDVSTIHFSLDGVHYEIDLTRANADRLRTVFTDYVDSARRRRGKALRKRRRLANIDAPRIRAWAAAQGFEVSQRGRLSSEIITAYREAQAEA
jgi:hypothetical protein